MIYERDLGKSVFFMSNHPITPRLFPAVVEVSKTSSKFVFVCDVAFAPLVELFGMDTVSVFSKNKIDWAENKFEVLRIKLLRSIAKKSGLDKEALKGSDVVNKICEHLSNGEDVFICTSGVSNKKAEWRVGAEAVAKRVNDEMVQPGFVYIPSKFLTKTDVKYYPTFGSIVPNINHMRAEDVSLELQRKYNLLMS